MDKTIFWAWNGWGLLLTGILALSKFLHIFVTEKFGSGTPLRKLLLPVDLAALVLIFVLSGWVAGLLAIPLGLVLGVILAKAFIPIFMKLSKNRKKRSFQ